MSHSNQKQSNPPLYIPQRRSIPPKNPNAPSHQKIGRPLRQYQSYDVLPNIRRNNIVQGPPRVIVPPTSNSNTNINGTTEGSLRVPSGRNSFIPPPRRHIPPPQPLQPSQLQPPCDSTRTPTTSLSNDTTNYNINTLEHTSGETGTSSIGNNSVTSTSFSSGNYPSSDGASSTISAYLSQFTTATAMVTTTSSSSLLGGIPQSLNQRVTAYCNSQNYPQNYWQNPSLSSSYSQFYQSNNPEDSLMTYPQHFQPPNRQLRRPISSINLTSDMIPPRRTSVNAPVTPRFTSVANCASSNYPSFSATSTLTGTTTIGELERNTNNQSQSQSQTQIQSQFETSSLTTTPSSVKDYFNQTAPSQLEISNEPILSSTSFSSHQSQDIKHPPLPPKSTHFVPPVNISIASVDSTSASRYSQISMSSSTSSDHDTSPLGEEEFTPAPRRSSICSMPLPTSLIATPPGQSNPPNSSTGNIISSSVVSHSSTPYVKSLPIPPNPSAVPSVPLVTPIAIVSPTSNPSLTSSNIISSTLTSNQFHPPPARLYVPPRETSLPPPTSIDLLDSGLFLLRPSPTHSSHSTSFTIRPRPPTAAISKFIAAARLAEREGDKITAIRAWMNVGVIEGAGGIGFMKARQLLGKLIERSRSEWVECVRRWVRFISDSDTVSSCSISSIIIDSNSQGNISHSTTMATALSTTSSTTTTPGPNDTNGSNPPPSNERYSISSDVNENDADFTLSRHSSSTSVRSVRSAAAQGIATLITSLDLATNLGNEAIRSGYLNQGAAWYEKALGLVNEVLELWPVGGSAAFYIKESGSDNLEYQQLVQDWLNNVINPCLMNTNNNNNTIPTSSTLSTSTSSLSSPSSSKRSSVNSFTSNVTSPTTPTTSTTTTIKIGATMDGTCIQKPKYKLSYLHRCTLLSKIRILVGLSSYYAFQSDLTTAFSYAARAKQVVNVVITIGGAEWGSVWGGGGGGNRIRHMASGSGGVIEVQKDVEKCLMNLMILAGDLSLHCPKTSSSSSSLNMGNDSSLSPFCSTPVTLATSSTSNNTSTTSVPLLTGKTSLELDPLETTLNAVSKGHLLWLTGIKVWDSSHSQVIEGVKGIVGELEKEKMKGNASAVLCGWINLAASFMVLRCPYISLYLLSKSYSFYTTSGLHFHPRILISIAHNVIQSLFLIHLSLSSHQDEKDENKDHDQQHFSIQKLGESLVSGTESIFIELFQFNPSSWSLKSLTLSDLVHCIRIMNDHESIKADLLWTSSSKKQDGDVYFDNDNDDNNGNNSSKGSGSNDVKETDTQNSTIQSNSSLLSTSSSSLSLLETGLLSSSESSWYTQRLLLFLIKLYAISKDLSQCRQYVFEYCQRMISSSFSTNTTPTTISTATTILWNVKCLKELDDLDLIKVLSDLTIPSLIHSNNNSVLLSLPSSSSSSSSASTYSTETNEKDKIHHDTINDDLSPPASHPHYGNGKSKSNFVPIYMNGLFYTLMMELIQKKIFVMKENVEENSELNVVLNRFKEKGISMLHFGVSPSISPTPL